MSNLADDLFGHGFSQQVINDQEQMNSHYNCLLDTLAPSAALGVGRISWLRRLWNWLHGVTWPSTDHTK